MQEEQRLLTGRVDVPRSHKVWSETLLGMNDPDDYDG
jgi:hypothetical protein